MPSRAANPTPTATRPNGRVRSKLALGWTWLGACALVLCGMHSTAAAQEGTANEIRGFSIPNTRSAKVRMRLVLEHIDSKRWAEAIEGLQELLEFHKAELVPVGAGMQADSPVFRGASGWAAEQLANLPEQARALYARRYGERASASLNLARSQGARQAVIAVAERWPTTTAAQSAWWTLGDMELEYGNLSQARQAWARAMAHRISTLASRFSPVFDGDNLADWQAALEETEQLQAELSSGEQQRIQLCISTLGRESSPLDSERDAGEPRGSLRLPGQGEGASGCPGPEASSWPRPFHLPENGPFELGHSNLFPVRFGDLVYVTDSLQLFAIHAYSGQLKWSSELPEGWAALGKNRREFFAGISREDTMIAPAASEHIVVSAHQVPVSDISNEEFHNISITTVIPDRRLYAYDTETGRELWNHHPTEDWDGESGSFVNRMSVAGPPVISASRVIVPLYRMYGRIEFYAACFDLISGELLWHTQLVSGQRELNMFARSEKEFSAPPVRIEQDRVVVATQLGAVAVLDLFSGKIIWETLYEAISPPQRSHFNAQPIKNIWRNAPPVVADGVVVVTPFDCQSLLGFDLETGRTLWSLSHDRIRRIAGQSRAGIDLLIGADASTVYLGSWPVTALRAAGGLHRDAPEQLLWRYPGGRLGSDEATTARAIVLKDRVLIPTHGERIEVDRFGGGRQHKSQPWNGGRSGNMLVEDGTLYTLSSNTLDGYFEWGMLLERARGEHELQGQDGPSTLYLASLLVERSRTQLTGGRTLQAKDHVAEAEGLLRPLLEDSSPQPEIHTAMHELLRIKSRLLLSLANSTAASQALRQARAFAPSLDHLRDTLLEEYMVVRSGPQVARDEILNELLQRCSTRTLDVVTGKANDRTYGWRFAPVMDNNPRALVVESVDLPMWVILERASLAADDSRPGSELEQLHQLLEFWPDESLPSTDLGLVDTVTHFVGKRIGTLIEEHGRKIYSKFDEEARVLLAQARTAGDRTLLEVVSELYPHSLAGREANDDLLAWAIREGDVEEVSRIALSELPERFNPKDASARQSQLLLFVAAALETAGNSIYSGALYRNLAQNTPQIESSAPTHGQKSLATLAQEHPLTVDQSTPKPLAFGSFVDASFAIDGAYRLLGEIPPELDSSGQSLAVADKVLLYIHDESRSYRQITLTAISESSLMAADPSPLWSLVLPSYSPSASWRKTVNFLPGLALITVPEGLFALDRETGNRRWKRDWQAYNGDVKSVTVGNGMVFAAVRTSTDFDVLYAFDGVTGAEVWQAPIDPLHYDRRPLIGNDRVVLLPRRSQTSGQILDIFSGRLVHEFELPSLIHQSAQVASWIEDGLLIVPWFLAGRNQDRNRLLAIDLWDGSVAWDLQFKDSLGGRRQLRSILQHEDKTYLVLTPNIGAQADGVRGILAELHLGIGALRRVGTLEFEHDQRFIGIPQERRVRLEHPTVYLHSFSNADEQLKVQALSLPFGNPRWTTRLQLTRRELYNSSLQLPIESEDSIAMVFSVKKGNGFGSPTSNLYLLDNQSGVEQQVYPLSSKLGTSNEISLQGIGPNLLLGGDEQLQILR